MCWPSGAGRGVAHGSGSGAAGGGPPGDAGHGGSVRSGYQVVCWIEGRGHGILLSSVAFTKCPMESILR